MRQPDLSEPLVSVVVPANNEAATVPVLVEKTAKTFAGWAGRGSCVCR